MIEIVNEWKYVIVALFVAAVGVVAVWLFLGQMIDEDDDPHN